MYRSFIKKVNHENIALDLLLFTFNIITSDDWDLCWEVVLRLWGWRFDVLYCIDHFYPISRNCNKVESCKIETYRTLRDIGVCNV